MHLSSGKQRVVDGQKTIQSLRSFLPAGMRNKNDDSCQADKPASSNRNFQTTAAITAPITDAMISPGAVPVNLRKSDIFSCNNIASMLIK
jgi:hypothetical protein